MPVPQNLLLIGATGAIGKHILASVVGAKSNFKSLSILTSPATVESKADLISSLKAQGVKIITGDLSKEDDVKKAYAGIDTVVSSVGRTVIASQVSLVQWATEAGIKWFFPSEYGTDIEYSPQSKDEKPHQAKLKVRAALQKSGMEYTYVVVGPYPEMFIAPNRDPRVGSFYVKDKKAFLLGDGNGKIGFTAMPDVGKFVVGALLHHEQSKNKALKVNSFTATPHEILAEFEKQTNSKWDINYTSLHTLKAIENEAWEAGLPSAALVTLRRIWTEGGSVYEKTDNELIGVTSTETLADIVKQVIERDS